MYALETSLVDLALNPCFLPFISYCAISCAVPKSLLVCVTYIFNLWVFSDSSLNLINLQILFFASCIFHETLILAHIRPTLSLNMKNTVFVKATNRIMYVEILVIMHVRRWVLAVMMFMMYIMTLVHCQQPHHVSHSWSSSSPILESMVARALAEGSPFTFPPYSWGLESGVSSLPVLTISKSSGLWIFHILLWGHQC